jgi:hypothetical protein
LPLADAVLRRACFWSLRAFLPEFAVEGNVWSIIPRIASRNFVTGCLTNDVTGGSVFWS